ncbi:MULTISPECIES: TrkA family potassium uptake protein [Halobacterium]|uniref:potassium channel family protein n=1 Tax=Halobacterium TaxID=2239 RepID=UPI001962D236|nr:MULTISPECIES: TrkA family potassium uptake protein [Halobacterium]MCF2207570.1 TrkA family potassium uptake protein [Halobacterium salinarum]MCF2237544.1 TrkA family potassium uptake protein [Halobacterium salinarum]MCF2241507.1 TrkA family potassium uptake protein [Halobacterium salinarum]MDL0121884.1 TrkA family potassium uptake protein [Halobacterium salinarum]MDL0127706.1 TrkA family potassium uptake protein [Halobacterium salinarum]
MDIVIVGAGRVGSRTARVVTNEDHAVTVIEQDYDRAERARTEGFDVVEGDGTSEDTLLDAGIDTADAIGALTSDLNTNFIACMVGNHHDCRTVLRIDEDYREDIYRKYADEVDEIVYPERLGAIGAKNALLGGNVTAIADLAEHLQVVQLTVTDDAPMRGYSISELELPAGARLLAFGKHDASLALPLPSETLETGDRIAVLAEFDTLDSVRQILVGNAPPTEVA